MSGKGILKFIRKDYGRFTHKKSRYWPYLHRYFITGLKIIEVITLKKYSESDSLV